MEIGISRTVRSQKLQVTPVLPTFLADNVSPLASSVATRKHGIQVINMLRKSSQIVNTSAHVLFQTRASTGHGAHGTLEHTHTPQARTHSLPLLTNLSSNMVRSARTKRQM